MYGYGEKYEPVAQLKTHIVEIEYLEVESPIPK